ncbi:MAG: prephenate dehydratase [Dehalococcoidia bacterium]
MKNIGYLGPKGTFTDEAAYNYASNENRIEFSSLLHLTEALENHSIDEIVVPIENSLHGTVIEIIDYLINSKKAHIIHEQYMQINLCLIGKKCIDYDQIEIITSKEEALTQCREFIHKNMPNTKQIFTTSTAKAIKDIHNNNDNNSVAVGPKRAAEIFNLKIIEQNIQDRKNNVTRFVTLSNHESHKKSHDKVSIAFAFDRPDAPGLLFSVFKSFADRKINLSKIESRPTGDGIGKYIFLIDFNGNIFQPNVQECINEISKNCSIFKVLGNYFSNS